jgi:hypothetical protein
MGKKGSQLTRFSPLPKKWLNEREKVRKKKKVNRCGKANK